MGIIISGKAGAMKEKGLAGASAAAFRKEF